MTTGMAQWEGTVEVPGGKVWFKRVGGGTGLPLLAIHGGPGTPHNYLRSLQRLADEREVIFWDQLGCGNSECPTDVGLWTLERCMAEVGAVVEALGLNQFHLFGNSWGGMLTQQYILDSPTAVASLTISNSLASMARFRADVARLKSGLDAATRSAIDRHEASGTTDCAEYRAAIRTWYQTHLCRAHPWPEELEESLNNVGTEIGKTMIGPSAFRIVGNLRNWDILDRLTEITMPTLLVAGKYDQNSPEHMREMHQHIAGSQFELFESSAHFPFIEEPTRFDQVMRNFLRHHDNA